MQELNIWRKKMKSLLTLITLFTATQSQALIWHKNEVQPDLCGTFNRSITVCVDDFGKNRGYIVLENNSRSYYVYSKHTKSTAVGARQKAYEGTGAIMLGNSWVQSSRVRVEIGQVVYPGAKITMTVWIDGKLYGQTSDVETRYYAQ